MKKHIKHLLLAMTVVLAIPFLLTGCTSSSQTVSIEFVDAGGAGTLTSYVVVPTTANDNTAAYAKNVQKIAEHLDEQVDILTSTQDIYSVSYGGPVSGGEAIVFSYSFDSIDDYNRKTMRLFNSVSRSAHNRLNNMGDNYLYATWTQNGDGTITFSQSGYMFTAISMWAYEYLIENDIPDAWDFTGDGLACQISYFGAKNDATFVRATESVEVKIGNSTSTVAAFSGQTANAVTARGAVGGTYALASAHVDDASIIVEHEVPETKKAYKAYQYSSDEAFLALTRINLDNLPSDRKIKVACVGDSITHGTDDRTHPAYPSYLQDILGDRYDVHNFGVGGTTLLNREHSTAAYDACEMYQPGLDFNPDVVIIMLGTNDSGAYAYKRFDEFFKSDYQELINTYKNLPSHPYVIVATSPYIVADGGTSARVNETIVPYQRKIFTEMDNVDGVVDIYAWSYNRYYLFKDGVHFTEEGYYSLAMQFARSIFGETNGYKEYKVNTVPGAVVQLQRKGTGSILYNLSAVADVNGIALCYATDGEYILTARAEDYARITKDISLSGGGEIEARLIAGDHNVALFRPVTASSDASDTCIAEYANDRNDATKWQPVESNSSGATLVFDLGGTKELHGIAIESWFQAYASGYTVAVSDDGTNYRNVLTVNDGKGNGYDYHEFPSASGKYVKVTFTKKGYFYNYEIYNLELFSNDERTVSERETAYIEEQARIAKERTEQEQNELSDDITVSDDNARGILPYAVTGGILTVAVIAIIAIVAVKKRKS